ncbi:39S ribosomal protein L30, mitochondrial [Habropoda laboriosa]|uniref:Large ribosomal subunit protein uL30m n=1 Tax=Habropoda laboriosa TaxID=597456 RepID=A0A0L7R554_9HYME|nr:PREDICTED: 39S ribosomal protein L30, mitochondrial [Habropoda laboriosa]KOC65954.1 39S ribosomal protein L30, mitochondrial [Habropoda laboriosa]
MATRVANVLLTFVRGQRHYTKAWLKDAVRYGNVKFHPRTNNHVDPPITPSKVFMVLRVKPFKGNPYWEKNVLEELGFEEGVRDPVFVKNTPEMCALLWKVKHLIKICPLQLPEKLPEFNESTEYYVHESGKIHVTGKIDPARYEATMAYFNSVKRLKDHVIGEKLKLLWLKGYLI